MNITNMEWQQILCACHIYPQNAFTAATSWTVYPPKWTVNPPRAYIGRASGKRACVSITCTSFWFAHANLGRQVHKQLYTLYSFCQDTRRFIRVFCLCRKFHFHGENHFLTNHTHTKKTGIKRVKYWFTQKHAKTAKRCGLAWKTQTQIRSKSGYIVDTLFVVKVV